ncbi:hypothetical protein WJX73_007024 [Symbiochloris irregularis]|uniref:Uncharacterized protein n=1 Tax=Symbiochloris irregularis TaxID=706552 RepID=A0AAW1PW41_9CHLO
MTAHTCQGHEVGRQAALMKICPPAARLRLTLVSSRPHGVSELFVNALAEPSDAPSLAPTVAEEVANSHLYNLEGDAPRNPEPYEFNLSNPYSVPNQNADWTAMGLFASREPAPQLGVGPVFLANPNASTQGTWSLLGLSGCIAIHASLSVTNKILFFERPHTTAHMVGPNPYLTVPELIHGRLTDVTEVAAYFDLETGTYTPLRITDAPFCGGHIYGPEDRTIIIGGDNKYLNGSTLVNGLQTVREYDFDAENITFAQNLSSPRWYPTLATLPSGSVFVAGGAITEAGGYDGADPRYNNPSYQIYSPLYKTMTPSVFMQQLEDTWPISLYPWLFLMPFSGSMLMMAGNQTRVYRNVDFSLDAGYASVPDLPVPISHPQTATVLALPLDPAKNYSVEVLVMGGCSKNHCSKRTPASALSWRIQIGTKGQKWTQEQMPSRRVMGASVLLPDGSVVVLNGAAIGFAGGYPSRGFASQPVTKPQLYNPAAPAGKRWSGLLADSNVPRLYHSTILLLPTGEVLAAGSEVTLEYKVQIYTPPYLLTGKPRPVIQSAPESVTWHQQYSLRWSGTTSIERVVLQKMSDNTHCLAMDLRQVVLEFTIKANSTDDKNGTLTFSAPPGDTIAPPGTYMLFILWQGVPSHAAYVRVKWEIKQVPGTTSDYYIYTPIKALLGCPSLFLSPSKCPQPTADDSSDASNVVYSSYRSDSSQAWQIEAVPDIPDTYTINATSSSACGGYLSTSPSSYFGDVTLQTRVQDFFFPQSQYWHFTIAA